MQRRLPLLFLLLTPAAACRAAPKPAAAAAQAPRRLVDSMLPIQEHLRRFRVGLDPLDGFTAGGEVSREALVRRFLDRLAARDTAALAGMLMSRREYAYVYYPRHIYAAPPYELDPGTFWTLIAMDGSKGLKRLLRTYGGRELGYRGLDCRDARTVEAPLQEWRCTITLREDGTEASRRLFGSIVAHAGRYKFGSYANDL